MKRTFLGLALAAALGGNAGAQQPQTPKEPTPSFPAHVEQVTVDVVVTDRSGQPVTDLKKGDLEILEDGVRQPVASFEMFQAPAAPAAPAPAAAPAPPRPPPSSPRTSTPRTASGARS